MLSRGNYGKEVDENGATTWSGNNNKGVLEEKEEREMGHFPSEDWFMTCNNSNNNGNMQEQNDVLEANHQTNLTSVFDTLDTSELQFILAQKTDMPMMFNAVGSNPLEGSFGLGCENHELSVFNRGANVVFGGGLNDFSTQTEMAVPNFGASIPFGALNDVGYGETAAANHNSLFLNRSKVLKPLDNFGSTGEQPTLFQKRAALRKNLTNNSEDIGSMIEGNVRKRKIGYGEDMDDVSIDTSALNYDSDGFLESGNQNADSSVTGGDPKGKKKGLPAKNLMAERRRRKKLNDRLFMLRSIVPKISKMDRASILGDAIEYMKELLQKINDLHNELESTPPGSSSLTPSTSLYPLTPTASSLPGRIKEELCPNTFASPLSSPTAQPARVEVRLREGRAVNIHMFCNGKPGILCSTMRALDNLGLEIQQAVISCLNGFAMDIFRAEQCKEGQDIHPDHIKAFLLESAGYPGVL